MCNCCKYLGLCIENNSICARKNNVPTQKQVMNGQIEAVEPIWVDYKTEDGYDDGTSEMPEYLADYTDILY